MGKYNINHKFRLRKIDKIWNFFIEEIKQNELISKKQKQICKILRYTKHLFNLASTGTEYVLVADFASLVDIPVNIPNFVTTMNVLVLTVWIKMYKSIVKKKSVIK